MKVREKGAGPPLLFLPGWLATSRWWDFQAAWAATTHRVHLLDYAAVDLERPFSSADHGVDAAARAVHGLLGRLSEPAVAVGWSLGAAVLLRTAELFGESRLKALVLVDQTPRSLPAPGWNLGVAGLDSRSWDMARAALANDFPSAAAQAIRACFARLPAPSVLESLTREALRWEPRAAAALLDDHWSRDYRRAAASVRVPTLLVGGGRSAFTRSGAMSWLHANMRASQIEVFPDAGHAPFLDAPDRFRDLLAGFLADAGRTAPRAA